MFTIFCTQVLGLGVNILVNVAVYPAIVLRAKYWWRYYRENNATATKLTTATKFLCLRIRGYPHKAWGGTLAATDKVSEFHRQNGSILRYFFRFPQGMHGIRHHVSVFLIRPTPTHSSNTWQIILKNLKFFDLQILPCMKQTSKSLNVSPCTLRHHHSDSWNHCKRSIHRAVKISQIFYCLAWFLVRYLFW